jgi:hypothetical protein
MSVQNNTVPRVAFCSRATGWAGCHRRVSVATASVLGTCDVKATDFTSTSSADSPSECLINQPIPWREILLAKSISNQLVVTFLHREGESTN